VKAFIGTGQRRQVSFVGPFGVGKTTAVFSLCGASVSSTEVRRSMLAGGSGRRVKQTTTVGLELGDWTAPDGLPVTIVGTPGQERFDVVRRSALPQASAVVLWLFGDHQHAALDARLWTELIAEDVPLSKVTVALTRLNPATEPDQFDEVRNSLAQVQPGLSIAIADPRSADDVAAVVSVALRLSAPLSVTN
jgi:uncharacterized protein